MNRFRYRLLRLVFRLIKAEKHLLVWKQMEIARVGFWKRKKFRTLVPNIFEGINWQPLERWAYKCYIFFLENYLTFIIIIYLLLSLSTFRISLSRRVEVTLPLVLILLETDGEKIMLQRHGIQSSMYMYYPTIRLSLYEKKYGSYLNSYRATQPQNTEVGLALVRRSK